MTPFESTTTFYAWIIRKLVKDVLPYGYVSLTGSQMIGGARDNSDIDLLYFSPTQSLDPLFEMGFRIAMKNKNYGTVYSFTDESKFPPLFDERDSENPASGLLLNHSYLPIHIIVKFTMGHYNAHILASRTLREIVKSNPSFPNVLRRLKLTAPLDYYAYWDKLINYHFTLLTEEQKLDPIE